jgi:anti-anti-sigma regulatory factor
VRERVLALARAAHGSLRGVVWDLSSTPYVDVAGARMIAEVQQELANAKTSLHLVDARARVRDLLRAEGLEQQVGPIGKTESVDDVIQELSSPRPS